MKKILTILGVIALAVIVVAGIIIALPSPTVDFSGQVVSIEEKNGYTVFQVEGIESIRYTVRANSNTKVEYCHKDDGKITLEEIDTGDTILGNYKTFSKKDEVAKNIKVMFES